MDQGVQLLDEALSLAHQEMVALTGGEFEQAVELAERRQEIISQAWPVLTGDNDNVCCKQLMKLADLQEQLTNIATLARDSIRADLQRSRRERQRMSGYHRAVGQALQ